MKSPKPNKKVINDITALRAFVMPDIYPFLLEVYTKEGKTEETLKEDIKKAREKYKELVSSVKSQTAVVGEIIPIRKMCP